MTATQAIFTNSSNSRKAFSQIASFENVEKINAYSKILKTITAKKADILYEYVVQDDLRIPESSYREKVIKIKTELLKENAYVIEGVKKSMIVEQLQYIINYYNKLDKIRDVVSNLGINVDIIDDITDITDEEKDICDGDPVYGIEDYKRHLIGTLFKYNAYCMNMLFNDKMTEEAILQYVCSDHYDKNWMKHKEVPFISKRPKHPLLPLEVQKHKDVGYMC